MSRTAYELLSEELDAALVAFRRSHGVPADFSIPGDRGWIEGFAEARRATIPDCIGEALEFYSRGLRTWVIPGKATTEENLKLYRYSPDWTETDKDSGCYHFVATPERAEAALEAYNLWQIEMEGNQ